MSDERRVLVIDDDDETRGAYVDYLREVGFSVIEAVNGLDGLNKINESRPDLVLTGIIMPQLDGFGLVEALKKNISTATIPVVFLSHLGRQEDESRAKELGVNDFIVRDVTPLPEVVSRLRAFFGSTEYLVAIDPTLYDGLKFARDMALPDNYLCETGERYVLRIRLTDTTRKHLSAEIICA